MSAWGRRLAPRDGPVAVRLAPQSSKQFEYHTWHCNTTPQMLERPPTHVRSHPPNCGRETTEAEASARIEEDRFATEDMYHKKLALVKGNTEKRVDAASVQGAGRRPLAYRLHPVELGSNCM